MKLNVVGGTYIERCREPHSYEIYGSGLRAALALSDKQFQINFITCLGDNDVETVSSLCNTYNIQHKFHSIIETISFNYDHPLVKPTTYPYIHSYYRISITKPEENFLYYGMIEAKCKIHGNQVVYDPQNRVSFKLTGSSAKKLAIILNYKEAIELSGVENNEDIEFIGRRLLQSENANVIVIKNGAKGAIVFHKNDIHKVPIYKTDNVWPIGSGDVFSAVFAWKWIGEQLDAKDAAMFASKYTAFYCETKNSPLPLSIKDYEPVPLLRKNNIVYLAGPFFTMAERWLIKEARKALIDFGNKVFSPYHDVGFGLPQEIAKKDLTGIRDSNVLFAIVSGLDSGTLFEIGYAIALKKRVVILAENVKEEDLFMLIGTDCEVCTNFSTAIYHASW